LVAVETRLGRYDVIRTLARGALTDLLLGRASGMEGFQRHVLIKRLRQEHAQDPGVLEMFVNEARLAAALHHHNIVQVLDIGEDGGQPFFAMEYVHGVDLRRLLALLAKRGEQLPFPHVVSIIAAAAAALHHAHEQRNPDGSPLGIVHRQVTPGNILVGYDGNVKIVDFGIAKAAIKRSETGAGVLRGSAPYMAPEQCAGQRVDRRSDVFALGIVLYELSTVRRLFKGANEFLTMSAVVNAEVPRPSQYRRDVPPELEVIMLKALSRDPLARFQTAGALAEALDKVARTVGVGASTSQLASYMKLQFGEQKEPWQTGGPELDPETTAVDFDGGASGLAPPPSEAVKNFAIPRSIEATKSSPINQARTSVVPPPRSKGKTVPPPDRSFNVATAVDSPMRAKTEVDPDTDLTDAAAVEAEPLPKQKTNVAAPPPPPPGIESTRPSKNDLTEVVAPLSVIAARPQTVLPPRRRTMLWLGVAGVAIAGVIAAIVLWPSPDLTTRASAGPASSTAAPAPTPTPEQPPAPPERSAMEMTARDYEAAHASADAAVADPVAAETADAAVAESVADDEIVIDEKPAEAVPAPIESKPAKPAVRPATTPTKRTTKPIAKRTTTKKAATKKAAAKKTKPKWNPDDLFLGE
jgi:serine/threonine-protein kinase